MTTPKQTFKNLLDELQRETRLNPKERNKDYKNLTLQLFNEHDRKTEEHELWRECYMIEEMIAILNRRFLALNSHKKKELELNQPQSASSFDIFSKYQQEIDDEGRSDEETDNSLATMYPDTERRDLEIQAAENYLSATWGIQRTKQTTTPPVQDVHEEKESNNPNPILTYKELQKEFQDADYAAVKQAVDRAIADGLAKGEGLAKEKRPWPMGGIADQYQIVNAGIREGRNKPTPAACKYQKIHRESKD
jgi:hypothetical protein